jgi:hypothetical protein
MSYSADDAMDGVDTMVEGVQAEEEKGSVPRSD